MINIGDYEIYKNVEPLGSGSFSEVYLGKFCGDYHSKLDKGDKVAIKIINLEKFSDKTRKSIMEEVHIMQYIKRYPHPHIINCYDTLEYDRTVYIIMEFCDSSHLGKILKTPFKEKYIKYYFKQLVSGLKYLDTHNIIHRDLKPANILLTNEKRTLKIADFGFARISKQESLYESICGSPLYMAPEIMGHTNYDKGIDLWSVGLILFELIYGYHLFGDCKKKEQLKHRLENTEIIIPPVEKNTNEEISDSCIDLLKRLLQKNKNRISWKQFFNHPWIKSNSKKRSRVNSSSGSQLKYASSYKNGIMISHQPNMNRISQSTDVKFRSYHASQSNTDSISFDEISDCIEDLNLQIIENFLDTIESSNDYSSKRNVNEADTGIFHIESI